MAPDKTVRYVSTAAVVIAAFTLGGCPDEGHYQITELQRVRSPAGWVEAYIVENRIASNDQNTQVLLSFDGGKCGSGAVSAVGTGNDLKLRWIDDTTLEVQHPHTVTLARNASGEILQCRDRKVKVVLTEK